MHTKHVLIVGHAVQYGGAEVYLVEILEELLLAGAKVTVLWCNLDIPEKLKQQFDALDIQVVYKRFGVWKPDSIVYNSKFARLLKEIECDLIFFNRTGGWGKYSDLVPTARITKSVPLACVEHFHPPIFPLRWREPLRTLRNLIYCRLQARCFNRIICMNDAAKERFASFRYGYKSDSVSRIYNGIDTDKFTYSPALAEQGRKLLGVTSEKVVLASGRLSYEKGPDVLLESWAGLPGRVRQESKLVLLGEGGMRSELEALAARLDICESIIFAGFQRDTLPYLCAADLFVMPSREESFGISLAEALAVGRRAVATRVGGMPELVAGLEDVELVDSEAVEKLSAAVLRQLKSIDEKGNFNSAAVEHIRSKFSNAAMRRETLSMLEQCL